MPELNPPRPMRFSSGSAEEMIRLGYFGIVRAVADSLRWPPDLPLMVGALPPEGEAAVLCPVACRPGTPGGGGRPEIVIQIAVRTRNWPKYAGVLCRLAGEEEFANRRIGGIGVISSRIESPLKVKREGGFYELEIGFAVQPDLSDIPSGDGLPGPAGAEIAPEQVEAALAARYGCSRAVRSNFGIKCRRVGVGAGEADPRGGTVRFPVIWEVTAPAADALLDPAWMPDGEIISGGSALRGVWTGGGEERSTFCHLGRLWVKQTRKMSFYLDLPSSTAAASSPEPGEEFALPEQELADALNGITPEPLIVGGWLAPGGIGLAVRWVAASGEYRRFVVQGRFPVGRETTALAENICRRITDTGRFGVEEVAGEIAADAGVKVRTLSVKVFG